ncbi:MAG TPA: sigma 54-interacting transcriptional regulator, partial [Thermoanaerobaculia bacterium]|nr:sigma 54-interacting transcriptional regulator [Thermoanaerobaculia bacterium]
ELPADAQAALLRVLQEREVTRVGGRRPIPVDVRLVAATHQDLESRIREGRFREDLYYRLKGVEVDLPPLRERKQDVPHLVRAFLEEFCRREGIPVPALRSEALALLLHHDFPGNVRELQNLIEGAVSLADGDIDADLVRSLMGTASQPSSPEPLDLESLEKRHISRVLKLTGGNKTEAARILGLDRKTLQRKGF